MNRRTWNKAVNEAKSVARLLRLTNAHRVRIAEIALRVCDIELGGKPSNSRYTIRAFADEIGINPSTVHEWTRLKRFIYDKLTSEQKRVYEEVSSNTLKPIMKGLTKDSRENTVRRKFDRFANTGFVVSKFTKYGAVLNTILYHVENAVRRAEIPSLCLKMIRARARRITKLIESELRDRGARPTRKLKPKPIVTAEDVWNEASV